MQENYFRNKKIFITGITGFVGTHLAKALQESGALVFGISKKTENKNIYKVNILDYDRIDNIITDLGIDICFHLAGESLVESGQEDPYSTFKVNTEGTLNILEIARKRSLEKVVVASTSHVYGKNKLPYYEGYTPKPSRPYETSKTCTDLIAQSYANTFNLPVLIPRFVNIFGPGDLNETRLIPKTISSVIDGKAPTMWGGQAIRDYLYIDDAIAAYLKLVKVNLDTVGKNRVFNFGGDNRISVKNLIEKIIDVSGSSVQIQKIAEERSEEISSQYVSWNKARKILKWSPEVSLDEGLKKTIAWYKSYLGETK